MKYKLVKEVVDLLEQFELENSNKTYTNDINGFKKWFTYNQSDSQSFHEPNWEGKENGRSADSAINTLLVHMNRFAKSYSKAAIWDSDFSSQEDFIYLINLRAFGKMTKMELIKRNIHEKPVGILVINRLIAQGWVMQENSTTDKRSKLVSITEKGMEILEKHMGKIRQATEIVTGDLTYPEKMELIRLLKKLNDFHLPIYEKNIQPENLLEEVLNNKN